MGPAAVRPQSLPADSPAVAEDVAAAVAPAIKEVTMGPVFVFIAVAFALGLIVIAARRVRTRISLRGEESTLADDDGDASGSLLTGILDGSSSHGHGSHHGTGDSGSHSGGHDSGSHGGFDGGVHH